jgi:hypothetical protein
MPEKSMIVSALLFCFLTAVNGIMLLFNTATPSRGAIAGMSYQDLINDPDLTRAVKSIVQECTVNVNVFKVFCEPPARL